MATGSISFQNLVTEQVSWVHNIWGSMTAKQALLTLAHLSVSLSAASSCEKSFSRHFGPGNLHKQKQLKRRLQSHHQLPNNTLSRLTAFGEISTPQQASLCGFLALMTAAEAQTHLLWTFLAQDKKMTIVCRGKRWHEVVYNNNNNNNCIY